MKSAFVHSRANHCGRYLAGVPWGCRPATNVPDRHLHPNAPDLGLIEVAGDFCHCKVETAIAINRCDCCALRSALASQSRLSFGNFWGRYCISESGSFQRKGKDCCNPICCHRFRLRDKTRQRTRRNDQKRWMSRTYPKSIL